MKTKHFSTIYLCVLFSFIFIIGIVALPHQEAPENNIHKVRLSPLYKSILNLSDIKYITSLTKNKKILITVFTNRKITKPGRMFLKKIIFTDINNKYIYTTKKLWEQIPPYLTQKEIKLISLILKEQYIENKHFILEKIISRRCYNFSTSTLIYLFSRHYTDTDFLDIITKCNNKKLLKIYFSHYKKNKINLRTYLYLIDEYEFKYVKTYLYQMLPNISYIDAQLIFLHYPKLINYLTKNLYGKVINDYISFKKRKFNLTSSLYGRFLNYKLAKTIIDNIEYAKSLKTLIKSNNDFGIFLYIVRKHFDLLSLIYKNSLKMEALRYKLFLAIIEMNKFSDLHKLRDYYTSYEIYSYIRKLKIERGRGKAICKELKFFFQKKDTRLYLRICRNSKN